MEIKVLKLGHIQTNCYLVSTQKAALVIDPGFKSEAVKAFLKENSDKERLILLTHAHFDHIGAALDLKNECNVKIAIGELENPFLSDSYHNLSDKFHAHIEPFSADILLKEEIFEIGDLTVNVISTPGHTFGSVCYLINGVLFSGDTLFYESIGRTDFVTGDYDAIVRSIRKLYDLNCDTVVLPGHGDKTTVKHEKIYNPFVRQNNETLSYKP